ncbi:MAG: hypothetical protein ACJAWV_002718, partial [Flammeovirgaceae bacterium]
FLELPSLRQNFAVYFWSGKLGEIGDLVDL